jgi:hypothetical protein
MKWNDAMPRITVDPETYEVPPMASAGLRTRQSVCRWPNAISFSKTCLPPSHSPASRTQIPGYSRRLNSWQTVPMAANIV